MKKLMLAPLLLTLGLSQSQASNFSSEDSVSMNLTGGNTELKTYNLKSLNKYTLNDNIFVLDGKYIYGESKSVRNSESWSIGLRYDRQFNKMLGFYLGEVAEANRFAGFRRRYNTDAGAKYIVLSDDKKSLQTELGYRYSIEKFVDTTLADSKDSKARLYAEGTYKMKKDLAAKMTLEYLYNFTETEDYLLNLEPSLTVTLTSNFALKTSYVWKYDNLPAPNVGKHDYTYLLTLIANF